MATTTSQTDARRWRGLPGALVLGILVAAMLAVAGCSAAPTSAPQTAPAETPAPAAEPTAAAPTDAPQAVTELEIKDLTVGKGAKVKAGDAVSVHYTGWLMDGTKFDSSLDSNVPFEFVVGKTSVIQGWHDGLVGMQVGGKRQLIIPPDLGYGAAGYPPVIPQNATLRFEIELLKITPGK